jgi:hypothetical protein
MTFAKLQGTSHSNCRSQKEYLSKLNLEEYIGLIQEYEVEEDSATRGHSRCQSQAKNEHYLMHTYHTLVWLQQGKGQDGNHSLDVIHLQPSRMKMSWINGNIVGCLLIPYEKL